MKYMCIGACGRQVDDITKIPHICSCGLIGHESYYPDDYVRGLSQFEAKRNNWGESEGHAKIISLLRIEYFKRTTMKYQQAL